MASIFSLQKKGGKTSSLDAMSRDTFRDQLSACFKAGTDRLSNFNRTCSNQALMVSIALTNIRSIKPSYEMLVLISEGYFAYRDIHCYSDSATLSIRRIIDSSTQFFAFDKLGSPLDYTDDLCKAYYVVMAWLDRENGMVTTVGLSYNLSAIVMVPTSDVIYELKRPFSGLASIQLFEDAEAFGRGFRNSNPPHGFMKLARSMKQFHAMEHALVNTDSVYENVASVGDTSENEGARTKLLEDLTLYYPRYSGAASALDVVDALVGSDRVKMRNQSMRDRQIEGISSYIHYLDFIFGGPKTTMFIGNEDESEKREMDEWIGVLKSSVFDPINLITQSDRCFLESASGFKYISVPGLDSAAIFAAVTSAFLLSLMANNRSEVFMSYVPYGPRDVLTNGEFDLGGYTNGSMWFKEGGEQTHPHFRDLPIWFGEMKINSRKAGNRDLIIDVVKGIKVIGNDVILHLNDLDHETYNLDEELVVSSPQMAGLVSAERWSICHGHKVMKGDLTYDDKYGTASDDNPDGPATLDEPSLPEWHKLSLEQDETTGQFIVPPYLMARRT